MHCLCFFIAFNHSSFIHTKVSFPKMLRKIYKWPYEDAELLCIYDNNRRFRDI